MNSKTYSVYAKNKNNQDERLFNINDLVVGNILTCEKNNNGITYISSPVKYIFEKSKVEGIDCYHETLSNKEVKLFSDMYEGPYITNIEKLTDYLNADMLLNSEDILDMQEAVNMISQEENKNKLKQKSL
ncbi:MAG: hypothetical protein IJF92_01765 [Bacilli bacterium]|nr:hypothetical protein [Bacilli bacterium]